MITRLGRRPPTGAAVSPSRLRPASGSPDRTRGETAWSRYVGKPHPRRGGDTHAILLAFLVLVAAYAAFVAAQLGFFRRILLALGPISLEKIPDRAARRYCEDTLFTTDRPVSWQAPALRDRYPDSYAWSAQRIQSCAGLLATLFQNQFDVERGDRIAILKTNHLDVLVLATAVVRGGAMACPINGKFAAADLSPYLRHIGARILITDVPTLRRVLNEGANLAQVEST